MTSRRWRRTVLTRGDGALVNDDWCLFDEQLGLIARIYKVNGGRRAGVWFWAVQIDEQGRPRNAGNGYYATGQEAKEAVEQVLGKLES